MPKDLPPPVADMTRDTAPPHMGAGIFDPVIFDPVIFDTGAGGFVGDNAPPVAVVIEE